MAIPVINKWSNRSFPIFLDTADVSLSAGDHKFRIDYYENTGDARVSFAYGPSPCAKTDITPTSNISVTVKTATGTKQCPVQLSHFGGDTDTSAVKYEVISQQAGEITIGMDDAPVGQGNCNNDLTWKTEWEDPVGARNLRVHTRIGGYDTGHDLFYGYQILADVPQRGCVIDSNVLQQPCDGNFCVTNIQTPIASASSWWIGTVQAAAQCFTQNYCPSHASLGDRYAVVRGNYGSDQAEPRATGWMYDYNVLECTLNAHCTLGDPDANSDANANTSICNLPTTNNSPNFSQNTCIDSIKPTVNTDILTTASGRTAGLDDVLGTADDVPWFKAGTYNIPVTDSDTHSLASGLDYCSYLIYDNAVLIQGALRTCNSNSSFSIQIGPKGDPAADCKTEGKDKCRIEIRAVDKANNDLWQTKSLSVDLTPPTAQ